MRRLAPFLLATILLAGCSGDPTPPPTTVSNDFKNHPPSAPRDSPLAR